MVDREPAKTFEDLIAWQEAHALVLDVYRITRLAIDLGYMPPNDLPIRALEVARVLGAYTATIASRPA